MEFCAGEEVAPEYVPLVEEEANFDGDDRRRFVWRRAPDDAVRRSFRVGIIGAGLGGLCAAIRLEQAGIPYTVFEKNPDVGGTWYENTYPDLRVDVPNHFYSYSFRPNPDWSHYFARRDELAEYIETCAKEYGVLPNVRCCTEVLAADYDERRGRWAVQLRDADGTEERIEVDALISAVGMLSRPSIPDLPGLDAFAGPWFHSARWDHDVDLKGRRVAVVGTGASAMQFAPAIAPDVEQLTIFQRSRHWVTPNPNYHRAVTDAEKWLFHHVPYYEGWYRFLNFWNSADRMYPAFRVDPDWPEPDRAVSRPNDKLRRVMTTHIERELAARPELVDEVLPDYPALGKRMLQDNGWYRALLRDNVTLVNERIAGVEPDAVVTTSGRSYPADVIVLATGFQPNKYLWPMRITGRGGRARRPLGRGPAGVPRHHRARVPEPLLPLRAEHQPGGRQRHRGPGVPSELHRQGDRRAARGRVRHDGVPPGRARRLQRAGRRRARAPRVAPPARAQLLQQQQGPRHHEHALEAARLLAHDEGTRARRLRPEQEAGVSGRLDGQVGIVTGAASGFGRATANRFAEEGARVVIVDLDEPRGAGVVDEVRAAGTDARLVVGDVSTLEVAQEAVTTATGEFGRLDVLVNNAGIVQGDDRDTWDTTEETWDRLLRVNLRSVYVCSKAAIPVMREAGGGSIVNVASIAASVCVGGAAYAAAKGGILSYTRHVARELAARNVRVNCVSPGFMRTPMTTGERLGLDEEAQEARIQGWARLMPTKRLGSVDDIANAIVYLASAEAGYVTGQEIIVDGAYVVR